MNSKINLPYWIWKQIQISRMQIDLNISIIFVDLLTDVMRIFINRMWCWHFEAKCWPYFVKLMCIWKWLSLWEMNISYKLIWTIKWILFGITQLSSCCIGFTFNSFGIVQMIPNWLKGHATNYFICLKYHLRKLVDSDQIIVHLRCFSFHTFGEYVIIKYHIN